MHFLLTNLTSPQCGLKLGVASSRNLLGPSANGRLKILHLLDLYKRVVLLSITTCTMEEQILGALLGVPSSQQAMIMMLQLMNMDFLENQSTVILKNSTELLSYASRLWFLLTQQLLPLYHARGPRLPISIWLCSFPCKLQF